MFEVRESAGNRFDASDTAPDMSSTISLRHGHLHQKNHAIRWYSSVPGTKPSMLRCWTPRVTTLEPNTSRLCRCSHSLFHRERGLPSSMLSLIRQDFILSDTLPTSARKRGLLPQVVDVSFVSFSHQEPCAFSFRWLQSAFTREHASPQQTVSHQSLGCRDWKAHAQESKLASCIAAANFGRFQCAPDTTSGSQSDVRMKYVSCARSEMRRSTERCSSFLARIATFVACRCPSYSSTLQVAKRQFVLCALQCKVDTVNCGMLCTPTMGVPASCKKGLAVLRDSRAQNEHRKRIVRAASGADVLRFVILPAFMNFV